ncbi:MAG TPA: cytochrome c oxidase subunit II [Chloroflexota bacterium]|jgi:cytochrome c oxidase subunit 2|nr:cytochrome c oxidase subunit II [Chloroflexota bacterium]
MLGLPIAPPQASTTAAEIDALVLFMLLGSFLIAGSIFCCIVVFCVKYRRRAGNQIGQPATRTAPLEITWTLVPLALGMIPFVWGARIYLAEAQPPPDAVEVYVVARQWMWKAEQPGGQAEIDALHVPVGRAVKLTMTSQDVIHSFYVPAFRVKADVLPGRYTTLWFQASQPGEYRLYCSQYCGTDHAAMIGTITALQPADFAAWLTSGATATNSPAAQGRKLFQQYGCIDCHETGRAPNLHGIYGQPVLLLDGSVVVADEAYIRESILSPAARVVSPYLPIMPSFAGQLNEDDLVQLLAYIKSIGIPGGATP